MLGKLIKPEIEGLIESRNWVVLKDVISDLHPSEIADIISDIEEPTRAIVFRMLPKDIMYATFEYLEFEVQEDLLKSLGNEEVADILNEISPDDRTEFLENLPGKVVKKLLRLLSPEERSVAVKLLGYPEDSVGRIMTPDFIVVKADWKIEKALNHIREFGKNIEYIDTIFVTRNGKLADEITLKEILLASPDDYVSSIMNEKVISLYATDDQSKAVEYFKEYDLYAVPVVNEENYLIGMVTADDVIDVIEEENTEDIQKFGGLDALEDSYSSTPILELVKKRAGWLVVLFLGELLTASAMAVFEGAIAKAVVLALFIPLIMSSGGNSGSQAATLIIRAMALQEITLKDWWKVMKREVMSGLLLGVILGIIGFLRIAIWSRFSSDYGEYWYLIGFTVAIALLGVVMFGTLVGSMLPFILRKFKLDPATSSAPFVATLVDVTGLVIYFSVAILLLSGKLL